MKITQYAILVQDTPQELVLVVNKAIQNGWQLVGRACESQSQQFFQTVVQYEVARDEAAP